MAALEYSTSGQYEDTNFALFHFRLLKSWQNFSMTEDLADRWERERETEDEKS
jgi:hypothetical protein